MKIGRYWKFVVAILGAVLVTIADVVTDNAVTPAEWVTIAAAFVTAVGVYLVPNLPMEAS